MINLLGDIMFGYGQYGGRPVIYVFGYPIHLYAIIIVSGMCIAMLIAAYFFKKRGYDPYDMAIYGCCIIPMAIFGCRLYVFIFPWEDSVLSWSNFFNFSTGGLGIYGGVILGYITAYIVCKIRKQDFRIVADAIMPGLLIAQSIGRWGNFVNQEAYGSLITNANWQWFPFAVYIDSAGGWYQATFFYESLGTFIGFVICMILVRKKNYRLGWLTAFYGIYYGIVRLLVESLRTDSLYLYIGSMPTDIKISQLVSVFTIIIGIWTLTKIYRKNIHAWYSRYFSSEREEVSKSRYVTLILSAVSLVLAVVMFALGGESKFIAGFFLSVLAIYSALGALALHDRLKLYCPECGNRCEPEGGVATQLELSSIRAKILVVVDIALVLAGLVLLSLGISGQSQSANTIVVAVIFFLLCVPITMYVVKVVKKVSSATETVTSQPNSNVSTCSCGKQYIPALNKYLLAIFPYKTYADYSIDHLEEWIDPDKIAREKKKQEKLAKKAELAQQSASDEQQD